VAQSPSGPAQAPLSAWQQLGATEVPPVSLTAAVSPGQAQVVNETEGAISDGDARAWVGAFRRTFGYLLWAVSRGQDQFLYRSGLSSAPIAVFQPNVDDITEARKAGQRVEYTVQVFRRYVVRPVPQSLQPRIQQVGFAWKPYAIYLDAIGPVETDWVDAGGNRTVRSRIQAGVAVFELIGGELRHEPPMGDVWVMSFDFDCTKPSSRQVLGPLCSQ
jgi:hypothetical protein